MNNDILLNAISGIDEKYLTGASNAVVSDKKTQKAVPYVAVSAAVVFVIALGIALFGNIVLNKAELMNRYCGHIIPGEKMSTPGVITEISSSIELFYLEDACEFATDVVTAVYEGGSIVPGKIAVKLDFTVTSVLKGEDVPETLSLNFRGTDEICINAENNIVSNINIPFTPKEEYILLIEHVGPETAPGGMPFYRFVSDTLVIPLEHPEIATYFGKPLHEYAAPLYSPAYVKSYILSHATNPYKYYSEEYASKVHQRIRERHK